MKGLKITNPPSLPNNRGILERMAALGDPIRCRILLVLERHEVTVSELFAVLQLPQSTVSRHLKVLAKDGWVDVRRDGTSRRYSHAALGHKSQRARLWDLVREESGLSPQAQEDARRLESILARRRSRSKEFFSATATRWNELRRELFGNRFDLEALLGLLEENWLVADLGAGTGQLARTLAPFVRGVIAIDDSAAMLEAAARRLEGVDNVELRNGRLEELPLEDASVDAVTLVLVLHHLAQPEAVLAEATRSLKPGGKILVVDMLPHEREDYRRDMGHVWLGFSQEEVIQRLEAVGLASIRFRSLTPDPDAKGPGLFCAVATRPQAKRLEFPVTEDVAIRKN